MVFDYKAIGLKIKMIRLQRELTQEQVAEMTELSCPHISNVETGNTKVSLPSLVKIANVLDASIDEILFDNMGFNRQMLDGEMRKIMSDCNPKEIRVIADTAKALKQSMRQSFSGRDYMR